MARDMSKEEQEDCVDYLQTRNTAVHQLAVRYLREWADGGEPLCQLTGICENLDDALPTVFQTNGYDYAAGVFAGLGYVTVYPLGDHNRPGPDCWRGSRGEERRDLCRTMADYIDKHFLS